MSTRTRSVSAAALISFAALRPAPALAFPIIDDFETAGVLVLTADGATETDSSAATWPSHCIAPQRTVHLTSNVAGAGGTFVSHVPYTAPNDVIDIAIGSGGGRCVLEYLPVAPADLTDGGQNDRVEVDFQAATQGAVVELRVWDFLGGFIAHSLPSSLLAVFPFSAWAGNVDPTQIVRIELHVIDGNGGLYLITDIRCQRGNATKLKFDASDLVAIGPPYPGPWFDFEISDAGGPVEKMSVMLQDALTVSGGQLGTSVACMDDGGDVGMFGESGQLVAMWDGMGAWEDSHFVMPFDISPLSGIDPVPFLTDLPVVTTTSTGFLLSFDVWRQDSDGAILTTSRRQMTFDVPAGQAVRGINPCCSPPAAARLPRGTGYSGFVLDFDVVATGGSVEPDLPLFEAIVTGDCAPATATGVLPPVPATAGRGPALRALPSVTRGGTELVLGAPARSRRAIHLFDVTGRLVRQLGIAAGARGVTWDGRSAAGARVPAGVYFARVEDAGADGSARVVVVR